MPLITISENLGSGGMSIARRVAEKLDINPYDDDRLQKEAVDLGIRTEDLKKIDLKFIHIDVIEPGVARISGMVLSPDDQTTITETVESVTGISSVQSQIVPLPQGYG